MTDLEFEQTRSHLQTLATLAYNLDLAGFLKRVDDARDLGPLQDPVAHQDGTYRLEQLRLLASAATSFQIQVRAIAKAEGKL